MAQLDCTTLELGCESVVDAKLHGEGSTQDLFADRVQMLRTYPVSHSLLHISSEKLFNQ